MRPGVAKATEFPVWTDQDPPWEAPFVQYQSKSCQVSGKTDATKTGFWLSSFKMAQHFLIERRVLIIFPILPLLANISWSTASADQRARHVSRLISVLKKSGGPAKNGPDRWFGPPPSKFYLGMVLPLHRHFLWAPSQMDMWNTSSRHSIWCVTPHFTSETKNPLSVFCLIVQQKHTPLPSERADSLMRFCRSWLFVCLIDFSNLIRLDLISFPMHMKFLYCTDCVWWLPNPNPVS